LKANNGISTCNMFAEMYQHKPILKKRLIIANIYDINDISMLL